MKNPIRRIAAILATCLGALTIAVAVPGIASAHTATVTGTTTCVDLKTGTYPVTWTADPTEDRYQYSIDQAGWTPAGSSNYVTKINGVYPNSTLTENVPATTAVATKTAGFNWRDQNVTDPAVQQDHSGSVNRPANCALTPVTPAVTYTPPTCFAAGTVVAIAGTGYTFGAPVGTTSITLTATALPGYSLTKSVFGPYAVAQITGEVCKVISTPVAPTVTTTEVCGVLDTFTAGPTVGVVYSVTSGSLTAGQVVVITATPAPGYKFAGESQSKTYTVTGGAVEVCTVITEPPTTTVPPTPCTFDTSLPADSPLCVPPTTVTPPAPPAPPVVVPENPVLPATGRGSVGGLLIAALIVAAGSIMALLARRKTRAA